MLWLYFFPILSLLFFFCSRPRDFSLTRESNSQSDYRWVFWLLPFRLKFLSFIDHFLLTDPVRRAFVGFGISTILFSGSSGIGVSSCSVLSVCPRFLISAFGVFSFFVSYAYFDLRCLVFALPSFIHAQSVHEFALLACRYSRWVF